MREHLRVSIVAYPDRMTLAEIEHAVLLQLDPPLNLMGMPATDVRRRLRQLRAELGSKTSATPRRTPPVGDVDRIVRREAWLKRVDGVRRWSRAGERAPHKPLLLLFALGRLASTGQSAMRFVEAEEPLSRLLRSYGPPRSTSAGYPFRRLQNDGLWVVETPSGDDPGDEAASLRRLDATGHFADEFESTPKSDPGLVVLTARMLLEENRPDSLHDEIAQAVGLDLDRREVELVRERLKEDQAATRRRDAGFRQRVLVAYEYRCAFCLYDGRLETTAVGLDAAHVRWWAFDGPDTVENALCLCTFHHRLLDLGVLGVSTSHEVTVSKQFVGHSSAAKILVLDLLGSPVLEPQAGEEPPADAHLTWHREQVFRGPARAG